MSERPAISLRLLGLIGLWGGLGGAVNAGSYYAVCAANGAEAMSRIHWHLIPAGAAHGAILAIVTVGMAQWLYGSDTPLRVRVAAWPIVGWLAGWLSWIPIKASLSGYQFIQSTSAWDNIGRSIFWPFIHPLWGPYLFFGLVGVVGYALFNLCRQLAAPQLWRHVLVASAAGVLGSLWWWIVLSNWWFSLLHGTIWGSLVGYGVWRAQRFAQRTR